MSLSVQEVLLDSLPESSIQLLESKPLFIENEADLLNLLPKQFETRIKSFTLLENERRESESNNSDTTWFHTDIRIKINTSQELLTWVETFEHITKSRWIKSSGAKRLKGEGTGKSLEFKQSYVCHQSSLNKVQQYKMEGFKGKNENCTAKMYARIRRDNENARKKDPFYGYFGDVSIKWTHSHAMQSTKSLNYLRNPQLKELFEREYFEQGLLPSAASEARKEYVSKLPGFDVSWLDNRAICPDRRLSWRWYNEWRNNHPGPLPPHMSNPRPKRTNASKRKRDELLEMVADLMTQRFTLLTGNASPSEIQALKVFYERLENADTKEKLVGLLGGEEQRLEGLQELPRKISRQVEARVETYEIDEEEEMGEVQQFVWG